ncbi:MAG: hypothetical protein ACP5UB_10985 [Candidatus Sumerlaeaceae bacterium]
MCKSDFGDLLARRLAVGERSGVPSAEGFPLGMRPRASPTFTISMLDDRIASLQTSVASERDIGTRKNIGGRHSRPPGRACRPTEQAAPPGSQRAADSKHLLVLFLIASACLPPANVV